MLKAAANADMRALVKAVVRVVVSGLLQDSSKKKKSGRVSGPVVNFTP